MMPLFHLLESHGHSSSDVLRAHGIDPRWATDPNRRVSSLALDGFWDRCADALGDDAFGLHVAELSRADTFGVVSHFIVGPHLDQESAGQTAGAPRVTLAP